MDFPTDSIVLQANFTIFSASGDELFKWNPAPLSINMEDSIHYSIGTGEAIYKLSLTTKKEPYPLPE